MTFEKARQHFEKKTKKPPEVVEGDWKQFTKGTKAYLRNKQKQVARFIDTLDYPNKENDKSKYLTSMNLALDNVLDENQATKEEMKRYRGLLYKKSSQLKQTLLHERKLMEIRQTKEKLKPSTNAFKTIGLPLKIEDSVTVYLKQDKGNRLPLEKINRAMETITKSSHEGLTRQEINKNKNLFYEIFNHYCWGDTEQATKKTTLLEEKINFFKQCSNVREKTGLRLNNQELNGMMSALIKTGVPKEHVGLFIVNNVEKLKKLDKKSYGTLTKTLRGSALSHFLLISIIAIKEGKTGRAIDAIKLTLTMESTLAKQEQESRQKLKSMRNHLKREQDELNKYLKKNPKNAMDENIASLHQKIAVSQYSIAGYQKELTLVAAKRSLANSYLSIKRINPSSKKSKKVIDDILKVQKSVHLERIAVDDCNAATIPQLELLRSKELKFYMTAHTLEVKKWYAKNPTLDHPLNLHDILNDFSKTGKLSTGARRVFDKQLSYQTRSIEDLMNEHVPNEKDAALYFESLGGKFDTFESIPQEKKMGIAQRLTGYMSLLNNLRQASITLLGNYQSLQMLWGKDKALTKKIKTIKDRAAYCVNRINEVGSFLGKKPQDDIPKAEEITRSPLFGPLIQKEISPHQERMQKHFSDINDASRPLPYIGKRIEKQAKTNPRLVNYRFEQGIGQVIKLATTIKKARNNAIKSKKELTQSLHDTKLTEGLPPAMRQQREKYIKQIIANITKALNNPKSPISLASIKKVYEQADNIKTAQEKYNREGFWKGVATAAILAGAVCFAIGGGWAASAFGAKLFGTATAAGIIPVSTGVANFAVGSMSMMGVAGGSVIGSRLVQSGFDELGLVNFGGAENIWNPEDMATDYATSFTFSLLAVGAAKGVVSSLKHISTAKYFAFRFPGLVNFSKTALGKIKSVSKIASPGSWFQSGNTLNKQTLLRRFGAQVGEESAEEGVESIAGKIHPMGEFIASIANASDGYNMDLSMNKIKAADVGITTEGSKMVYTTKSPQEFIANLKQEVAKQKGSTYETVINQDGSVTLTMVSQDINPKTGKKIERVAGTMDIHPAKYPTNLSSDVEITRVSALNKIEGEKNTYTVNSSEASLSAFNDLYKRGFTIVKGRGNNFRVTKGETAFTLKVPTSVITETKAQISRWVDTPMKARAYKAFVELNGNYKAFVAKHPKLAKVLPTDLAQSKFIPMPVLRLTTGGLALKLNSISEIRNKLSPATQNLNKLLYKADDVNSNTREATLDNLEVKENREIVRETYFDKATGLFNRNGLALGENILIQGKKLSVANFDADHFRASNDLKGRAYGDAQIKIIAKNINNAVRNLRKAGHKAYGVRMGGEEFTLMTTAPRKVLHKEMLAMSAKTKKEVLSTLSTQEKHTMAEQIAATKYANDLNGINKAYKELGGISGSVIGIDGKHLNWKEKGNMKKSLMYADAAMEDLKKINGRGNFDLDPRNPKSTAERINNFQIHNVLDIQQKQNLNKEAKRLFGKAQSQFDTRLKTFNKTIEGANPKQQSEFRESLGKVLRSPDSTKKDVGNVLRQHGADPSLAQKLQNEYVANLRDYGNYTGARTMTSYQHEMTQGNSRFNPKNSWKIEIGKFKSINETLGHVGGDAFLTFAYQDVIMDTVKEMKIPFGTGNDALIVSQKGADFHFCFSKTYLENNVGIEKRFKDKLNEKYKEHYKSFVKRLDTNSNSKYQTERNTWLDKNEKTNPNSKKEQYKLFFHK